MIKEFFLAYNEALSNDFVLSDGGRQVELLRHDIQDWKITFVDTGLHTSIGERLKAVRRTSRTRTTFLANYGDVLTDAPLPTLIDEPSRQRRGRELPRVSSPGYTFHLGADATTATTWTASSSTTHSDLRINGGYFVFQPRDLRLHRTGRGSRRGAVPRG